MASFEFRARTRIVTGLGCIADRLPDELRALGDGPVAVIADAGFANAGLLEPLLAGVPGAELPVCALVGVDPDVRQAEDAASAAVDAGAHAVLAVGGGSALC